MNRTTLTLAFALAVGSDAAPSFAGDAVQLDEVVVTANRMAQTADETLAPVTVLTREDIERSQEVTVAGLLNQASPGVQVMSYGGPGSITGVYMRGTKTAQTLILMDGMKINAASSGAAPLEYIATDQIERIEIVRGPRSTLYGADAVGGVINIITKKGQGTPTLTVKAGAGSRRTGDYAIAYQGEVEDTQFSLGAELFETGGYDRTVDHPANGSKGVTNSDDDAFRNKSLSARVSKRFAGGVEAGVSLAHFEGMSEYDDLWNPTARPVSDYEESMLAAYVAKMPTDIWNTRLEAGYIRDNREESNPAPNGYYKNDRYSVNVVNDITWADHQLLITGIDYSKDKAESSEHFVTDERDNVGVFAQNLTQLDQSEVQLGLRYDGNEAFGDQLTGNVAWGWDVTERLRVIASYGTAFRAPTFNDMYLSNAWSAANPDLKPEKSDNIDIELRRQLGTKGHWSVNLYQNNMDDMLNSVMNSDGKWQTENIDKARIRGIEFEVKTELAGFDVAASATHLDPEQRSGATNNGNNLHYRARKMMVLSVDKTIGRWNAGTSFKAQGDMWTDAPNTNTIPGYGTVDLRGSFRWSPELKIQFKVVNLFNKDYQPVEDYRGEGRAVFVSFYSYWTGL